MPSFPLCGDALWANFSSAAGGRQQPLAHLPPNLSACARLTLMVWAPALFFWALAPFFALQLWRVRARASAVHRPPLPLPLSRLALAKMAFCLCLMVVSAADLFHRLDTHEKGSSSAGQQLSFWVLLSAPLLRLLTVLGLLLAIRLAQLHGIVSSGIIHLSWLLWLLCSLPDLYALVHQSQQEEEGHSKGAIDLALCLLWSLGLLIQFLLFFFADLRQCHVTPPPAGDDQSLLRKPSFARKRGAPSPELDSSFFSRLVYHWFTRLPLLGRKRALTLEDLFQLNEGSRAQFLAPIWEKSWLPAVERYQRGKWEKVAEKTKSTSFAPPHPVNGHQQQGKEDQFSENIDRGRPSVVWTLFKIFKWELLSSGAIKLFSDVLQFANPIFLRQLILFVGDSDGQLWQGLALALAMFICSEIRSFCVNQYFFVMFRMGTKMQTVLTTAIYNKTLRLSNSARRQRTAGEIVNLMAIDVERFQMITAHIQQLWSSPLQIALSLAFLFHTLGLAALPGVLVMAAIIPLSFVSSFFTRRWQVSQMRLKDERSKLCNEILNGVKVVKLYAWEEPMMDAVEGIRRRELGCLLKAGLVRSVIDTFNFTSPFLVAIASFVPYSLLNPSGLTPQVAFVSLTLFNQLRSPMTMIGLLINLLVQTVVSNKRIRDFLLSAELDPNAIQRSTESSIDVRVKGADFAWESGPSSSSSPSPAIWSSSSPSAPLPTLRNISLEVPRGQLLALVGKVGSGKSSLLAALLGEMDKLRGELHIRRGISVAYVPQSPWVQNMSLRQNVTFGRPFCAQLYEKVIEACALGPDLDMLPQGDGTEIGEKGINLSGGQKARVTLARALYQQSDLVLLDDPLSAVDSHVGRWIFERVLGPEGMLRDRAVVLATHGLHFLRPQEGEGAKEQRQQQILVMEGGRIEERGTFEQLAAARGKFVELLATERKEEEEEVEEAGEEEEEEDYLGENGGLEGAAAEEGQQGPASVEHLERMIRLSSESVLVQSPSARAHCRHRRPVGQTMSGESRQKEKQQNGGTNTREGGGEEKGGELIKEERVETGRVKVAVYLDYFRAAGWPISVLFLFLYCANQGLQMARNFWLSAWADENQQRGSGNGTTGIGGQPPGTGGTHLGVRLGVYAGLGVAEALSFLLALLMLLLGSLSASRNLHSPVLDRVLRAPMAFFDTTPVGRVLNRFGRDVEVADTLLPLNLRHFVQCLTMVLSTLLLICISTWAFAVVLAPLFLLYFLILRLYVPTSRQLKRLESSRRSPIYSHFGESIQGAPSIRAFGRQQHFSAEMEHRVDALMRNKYLSLVANRWLAIRLEFLGNCVVLFAALLGALSREWPLLMSSAGLIGLSVSYALNITEVMNFAIRQLSELETNIVSIERLKEYTELDSEAQRTIPGKQPPKGWPPKGEIQFVNYSMRYRAGLDLVLRNIGATIRPSERVGIVGRTGAGKSSLTLALFRLAEPAGGTILIDGLDIHEMGLHDLRSSLTIIPQDPVLFSGSLRFNLDPFNKYTDARLWEALGQSHLRHFVSQLPDGLEHRISEGGENISLGQRQLMCLARALLRSSRILVLDEATASVDLATDALIQETIRNEFRNCTVFTIAHRLGTIMDYDRVLVLDQGEVCEFDAPRVLLENQHSLFARMVAQIK